jgi:hypothetical protein
LWDILVVLAIPTRDGLAGLGGLWKVVTSNVWRVVWGREVCVSTVVTRPVVPTMLSLVSCTQQLPNMKPSMHMPRCWPSDLRHSQTNMQVPTTPCTVQDLGLILYPFSVLGCRARPDRG